MAQQQQHNPLQPIDGNVPHQDTANNAKDVDAKPAPTFSQESQQHQLLYRKFLQQEQTGQQQGKYVSPSDNILSPASAKLNAFKERRFVKNAKPRTLFANTKSISSDKLDDSMLGASQDQTSGNEVQEGVANTNQG